MKRSLTLWLLLIPALRSASAQQPPVIPISLDAYRMWERWPYQRIGARAYMRSTYDRSGGNERADASHFLYQLADDFKCHSMCKAPGYCTLPATTTGMAVLGIMRSMAPTISLK